MLLVICAITGIVCAVELIRSKFSGQPPSWKRDWIWQPPPDGGDTPPQFSRQGATDRANGVDREPGWLGRAYRGAGTADPWDQITGERRRVAIHRLGLVVIILLVVPFPATGIAWLATRSGHETAAVAFSAGVTCFGTAGWLELERRRYRSSGDL